MKKKCPMSSDKVVHLLYKRIHFVLNFLIASSLQVILFSGQESLFQNSLYLVLPSIFQAILSISSTLTTMLLQT